MATKKRPAKKEMAVIVTTPTRDVWYGRTTDPNATPLVLTGARHCYQWGTQRGIGQLAASGPGRGAKIGECVGEVRVREVACVLLCSDEASAALDGATWAR